MQRAIRRRGKRSYCQTVRRGEHAVRHWPLLKSREQPGVPVLRSPIGFDNLGWSALQLVDVAAYAVSHRRLRARPAEMNDTVAADLQQVAGVKSGAVSVVDADVRPLHVNGRSTNQHHRPLAALQRLQLDGIQAG